MTVAELQERLAQLDPKLEVHLQHGHFGVAGPAVLVKRSVFGGRVYIYLK